MPNFCVSKKPKAGNKPNTIAAPSDNTDSSPVEQKLGEVKRRGTFYGKVDSEVVPLKVDFMRMVAAGSEAEVNRFVILTDSLLMVYDEDGPDKFYKRILNLKLSQLKPLEGSKLKVQESESEHVTMLFRDSKHCAEWSEAIRNVQKSLCPPANRADSMGSIEDHVESDNENEVSRNISATNRFKSKTDVELDLQTREYRLQLTKELKDRVSKGDVATASRVLDLTETYLKKGVFVEHNKLNEGVFRGLGQVNAGEAVAVGPEE